MNRRIVPICLLLCGLLLLLFAGNLAYGSVAIPLDSVLDILLGTDTGHAAWESIVKQARLPQAVTALLAGASLATSGLLLQTLFRNPLAGPSILGVADGANLGAAVVMLCWGGAAWMPSAGIFAGGYLAIVGAAFVGALAVLGIMVGFSSKVKSNVMLLIIGIMTGYLASSLVSLLTWRASANSVHTFVLWGMGSFAGVSVPQLPFLILCTTAGLFMAVLLIKPLNAMLLGENYAANLGVKVTRTRISLLLCTGLLTAVVTAFCGPVSFIGLAVPHIARILLGSSNHKTLVPVVMLTGACMALLCNMLLIVPGQGGILPLNAVTPLLGAPVMIYVIVNRNNLRYFH